MQSSDKNGGEYAILRLLDRAESLQLPREVICRNAGCGCGGECGAVDELNRANLITVEDGWVELTDEGRHLLGHDVQMRSAPLAE